MTPRFFHSPFHPIHRVLSGGAWLLVALCLASALNPLIAETPREIINRAILAEKNTARIEIISSLVGQSDAAIPTLLTAWRQDALFLYEDVSGTKIPVQLLSNKDPDAPHETVRVNDGLPLLGSDGKPLLLVPADLTAVEHNLALRRAMKAVLDLSELGDPDPVRRLRAVQTVGQTQDAEKLPALRARLSHETDKNIQRALREAIAVIDLKSTDTATVVSALRVLEELSPLTAADSIGATIKQAEAAKNSQVLAAARAALKAVESHRSTANFIGTGFRGLSSGSVLLVGALGLAITFGLMRVINMAHGEMIAVGAYTTFVVQNLFGSGLALSPFGISFQLPGFGATGRWYDAYFIVALPCSFIAAALAGLALERGVIRFLYRRPLESLLATWGVSLVLQQLFRLIFGSNNVQVSNPSFLSGNWTVSDVMFGWNRLFVIGFAGLIVLGTWLALNRTPLGLLIRAVMQNRSMASCMGVRTERVNMFTFALGSGLAGLAGAFLSQIGNVGPSLGQSYIIDSFMVVVVGGVGNLAGTVISAFGIGGLDQALQQYLPDVAPALAAVPYVGSFLQNLAQDSSVFGKILVLGLIILFLQWRPAGLFVTRSRNLDD